jgi:exportin-2 (importin alpha re-exporter)
LSEQRTDEVLSSPNPPAPVPVVAHTLYLLLEVFYDFNSQDLPEFFEDNIETFMSFLHKYLTWSHPALVQGVDEDDEEEGELERIRGTICEISDIYSQRYTEEFRMMGAFVETVWSMVTGLGQGRKYDSVSEREQQALLSPLCRCG